MSVKSVGVLGNTAVNTERGPSPVIWNQNGSNMAWWEDMIADPRLGLAFWEDFKSSGISPSTGSALNYIAENPWYAYLDSGAAITDTGIIGGGINLAASTTGNRGVALGSLTNSYQIITSGGAYQGRLAFECRVRNSTASVAASTSDMFIGLMDASGLPASAVPITGTGGTLATAAGFIGFHKRGGATHGADFDFVYNVAGGTPVYATNLGNIVNTVLGAAMAGATFYKLGFVFNPDSSNELRAIGSASTGQTAGVIARPLITVYVNGLPAAAFLTSTNVAGTAFPVTVMSPMIAWKQQSTTASVNADVDWIMVAQESIA
jgi:hypothetical protein